jgi:hypothetical protein
MSARRALAAAVALAAFILIATGADTVLRARSALHEGERWLAWSDRPELKKAHFDAEFDARRAALDGDLASGVLSRDGYDKRLLLARFERDRAESDSALDHARVWFESAANLFSPPESRWSARARVLLAETRERRRRERLAQGLPAEDDRLK